jgi:hypothetical protein
MKLFGYEFIVRKAGPVKLSDLRDVSLEYRFTHTPLTEAQKAELAAYFTRHYSDPDSLRRFH